MEKSKAYKLVRDLMDHHGLTQWKLEWMDHKTTAGFCYNSKATWNKEPKFSWGRIAISTHFAKVFNEEEMRDLALHEIAHALCAPDVHHGPAWKAMAKKIGCNGSRCLTREESVKVKSRYKGLCPQGHEFGRHRKTYGMDGHIHYCPPCYKKKIDAFIIWTDTLTGVTLNPRVTATKPEPKPVAVNPFVPPKQKQKLKLPKVVATPAPTSWKDRYDRGDTSFADVW